MPVINDGFGGVCPLLQVSPAVPRAFALSGYFPRREGPVYIVRQLAATALGAALLRLLFGNVFALGENLPAAPILHPLAMEVLVTAILMFVIKAVATDRRAMGLPAGLAIGGAVALNVLWAGPNQRRVNEPRAVLRTGPDLRRMDGPLHLLGRSGYRGGSRRFCIRICASHRTRRCLIPPGPRIDLLRAGIV